MRTTRRLAALFLPLLLISFLQAQSLADLAKKEKERRAAVKGKPAAVITSADVARVKKRPAVETTQELVAEEAAAEGAEAKSQEGAVPAAAVAGAEAAAVEAKPEAAEAEPAKPVETPTEQARAEALKSAEARTAELRQAAEDKQQLVELLTLKMNALYQEFYSLDNLKSRELLQAQISDTYDKLLKAQVDAQKAARDLEDSLAQAKQPSIWIR
ncbi:MAG TPA: hypothetical protein P5119_03110 [Candidatus Aminicenantes bacterium]|nr:hypothetical protein [Candidatus Aminicenantes bacterium]HRY64312.1 hypothetical protein [Candidatus Aminicenantes bacterium]HRZ71225.1 hypothetical protein [Candidatus Aminicenantes bacterium]